LIGWSYVDKLVEWKPGGAVVGRNINDVWLSIHVLTPLRQKPHTNLTNKAPLPM